MTNVMRPVIRILAMIVLLLSLSGCWDNRPVDERTLIFTLGLENGPKAHPLKIIFQFPTPTALIDYSAHKALSKTSPVADVSGVGRSVAQCFTQAQSKIPRDLYLGQIQLVEVASDLKPALFRQALLAHTRIGTMDMTPFIFVTGQPLNTVMRAKTDQAQFPTLYYSGLFSCAHCQTDNLGLKLWQFAADAETPGVDPRLPYVTIDSTNQQIEINRIALYRHFRIVSVLSPAQTEDFGLLRGLSNKGTLFIPQDQVSLRSIHGHVRLHTAVVKGAVQATFRITLTSTLANVGTVTATPAENSAIAAKASVILAQRCLELLKFTQAKDVDPLGVGRMLDWQHPNTYLKFPHWHQEYPKVAMIVHVHLRVYKLGNTK